MNNAPQVKIQYLVNYDLEISGQEGVSGLISSDLNRLSDLSSINDQGTKLKGKKGFVLSGGSVDDATGEVSGVLLDGTYTFFSDAEKSYKGIMGNTLSRNDYSFINVNDYESKSGTDLDSLLSSQFQGDKYIYYCSSDGVNFKSNNVYEIEWVVLYDKQYSIAIVDENSQGIYYVKVSENIYDEVELPNEFNADTTYYSLSYIDNSHYISTLKEQAQYITIRVKHENTYIRSLLIYFDPETRFINKEGMDTSEFATEISFSNGKKYDAKNNINDVDAPEFNKTITNDRAVFLYNFGEESTLTQIQININRWNKKNSFMKILKVVTGYTGIYDKRSLMKLDFTINKTNDTNQLRFGVTSNSCSVDVLDNDLMIDSLYKKDLIYKNIQVQISVDGVMQGIFYLNEKSSERGSNEWIFDCVDRLESLKNIKRPMFAIESRTIYKIMKDVMGGIVQNVVWENSAKEYCQSKTIEKSYFKADQTLYDLMLKCCQVGLLRVYIDRNDVCKITSGV